MARPELTLVIPIHDAQGALSKLDERIRLMLDRHVLDCEVVFVDDGSTDGSLDTLRAFVSREGRYRTIALTRRFGADRAIMAGIDAARGRAVIVMGGGTDEPPDVVPDLVAKWREGFDVVKARRRRTSPPSFSERVIAAMFTAMSASDAPFDEANFVLMSRRAVRAIRKLRETHRFFHGVVAWIGFRQTTLEYDAPRGRARSAGKAFSAALDALASSSVLPLRLGIQLGLIVGACGVLYALAALVTWLAGGIVPVWTGTVVLVTFLSSTQLVFLGILGEYVGRSYEQAKGRPMYLVSEKLGFVVRRRSKTEDFTSEGEIRRTTDRPVIGAPPPASPPAAGSPGTKPAPSIPPPLPKRALSPPLVPTPTPSPASEEPPPSSRSKVATKRPPPFVADKKL